MSIDVHRVITIFEFSDIYLLHPVKKIFRKFPKIAFLKFILILPQVFYLVDSTQVKKKQCFEACLDKHIMHLITKKVFLGLAYESRIPLDEFKPKKILKIENH